MARTRIAVLPGDFIGPEVIDSALKVLEVVSTLFDLEFEVNRYPFGGGALDKFGDPLPEQTRAAVVEADAVLMGSSGGPIGDHPWNKVPRERRVETGILNLRRLLGVFANLRPVTVFPGLEHLSPLREEVASGTDMLILRELTGGIYFGKPSYNRPDQGLATMVYERHEVERIARIAFESAKLRGGKVTNVDKANVLDVSQFWRDVVVGIHESEFPQVTLEHLYVDNAAMQIVKVPREFDVLVTGNIFGDILSDLAAVIPGSIGVLPSASLGGKVGLFEPVHGSAPDIAGTGIANPVGTILSVSMMLRYGCGQVQAADAVENAVQIALTKGSTSDLGGNLTTSEMTQAVIGTLANPISLNG
jgi:3-isopropylmalate dehydrogenase